MQKQKSDITWKGPKEICIIWQITFKLIDLWYILFVNFIVIISIIPSYFLLSSQHCCDARLKIYHQMRLYQEDFEQLHSHTARDQPVFLTVLHDPLYQLLKHSRSHYKRTAEQQRVKHEFEKMLNLIEI